MNKFMLLFALLYGISMNGQGKEDYVWPLGYGDYWEVSNPPYGLLVGGGLLVNFDSFTFSMKRQDSPITGPVASISDQNGQIIAYTQGCRIVNRNHQLMANGTGINAGFIHDQYCGLVDTVYKGTYPLWQGSQFLPAPNGSDDIYLLHNYMKQNRKVSEFRYSKISFQSDSLGKVTDKNVLVFKTDSLSSYLTSVRHANGRDWWTIIPNYINNKYYIFLFSPEGIHKVSEQALGISSDTLSECCGQVVFSADGQFFIKYLPRTSLHIFRFDRCTGVLSDPLFEPQFSGSGGVATSSTGQYLYVANSTKVYQYDLWAADILSSKIEVGQTDGSPAPFSSYFGQMQLAPDGKIYMVSPGSNHILHIIHHPERVGIDCDVQERGIRLLSLTEDIIPNFPHFRLGASDGSSCDTLGINNLPHAGFRHTYADSMTMLKVSFTNLSWGQPSSWQWDFGDPASSTANVSDLVHPDHVFSANGSFTVCQIAINVYGSDTLCSVVSIGVSGTDSPEILNKWVDIWPNPTAGILHISSVVPDWMGQKAFVMDIYGHIVARHNWRGQWTVWDISHLPAGVYSLTISSEDGQDTAVKRVVKH